MGSKIAPMGWMRETVVSDFFSLLVPGLSKTQPLAPPKVGRWGEFGWPRHSLAPQLQELKPLHNLKSHPTAVWLSPALERAVMLLAPVTAQISWESPLVAMSTKSSTQPEISPLPKLSPTLSCLPPIQDLQPTSALAYSPLCCHTTQHPPPCSHFPKPTCCPSLSSSPQAICDTSSVQILTHIFCSSVGASKSLISLKQFFMPKA